MKLNYPIIIKFDQNGLPKKILCPDLKIQSQIKKLHTFQDDFAAELQTHLNKRLEEKGAKIALPSEIKQFKSLQDKHSKLSSVRVSIKINKSCCTRFIPALAVSSALITAGSNAVLNILTLRMSSGSDEISYLGSSLAILVYLMVFYGAGTIDASRQIGENLDNITKYETKTLVKSKNKGQKCLKYTLYFSGGLALIIKNLINSITYYRECEALRDRAAESDDFQGSFFADETNMYIVAWLFAISSFISGIMFQSNLFGKIVTRVINFFTSVENFADTISAESSAYQAPIDADDEKEGVELTRIKAKKENVTPLLGLEPKSMCVFL